MKTKILEMLGFSAVMTLVLVGCSKVEKALLQEDLQEVIVEQEPIVAGKEPTVEEEPVNPYAAYGKIVDMYMTAMSEQWDMETLEENQMSYLVALRYQAQTEDPIGFYTMDLDDDGRYELLIGSNTGDEYTDKIIIDAYTLSGEEAVKLFGSTERSRYYIKTGQYEQPRVVWETSDSAFQSGWICYEIQEGHMIVEKAYLYDEANNPNAPWYEAWDDSFDSAKAVSVTEEDAMAAIEEWQGQYQDFTFLSLKQGFFVPEVILP